MRFWLRSDPHAVAPVHWSRICSRPGELMSSLFGVLLFVVALMVAIFLHEGGHFATAKLFGMKVERFFLGFGTTIWSFRRGETEYGIKLLPLGGFCKIAGMSPYEHDGNFLENERRPRGEPEPAPDPTPPERQFRNKPAWQRAIVLAAGSITHFLVALLLIYGLLVVVGLQNGPPTTTIPGGRPTRWGPHPHHRRKIDLDLPAGPRGGRRQGRQAGHHYLRTRRPTAHRQPRAGGLSGPRLPRHRSDPPGPQIWCAAGIGRERPDLRPVGVWLVPWKRRGHPGSRQPPPPKPTPRRRDRRRRRRWGGRRPGGADRHQPPRRSGGRGRSVGHVPRPIDPVQRLRGHLQPAAHSDPGRRLPRHRRLAGDHQARGRPAQGRPGRGGGGEPAGDVRGGCGLVGHHQPGGEPIQMICLVK